MVSSNWAQAPRNVYAFGHFIIVRLISISMSMPSITEKMEMICSTWTFSPEIGWHDKKQATKNATAAYIIARVTPFSLFMLFANGLVVIEYTTKLAYS